MPFDRPVTSSIIASRLNTVRGYESADRLRIEQPTMNPHDMTASSSTPICPGKPAAAPSADPSARRRGVGRTGSATLTRAAVLIIAVFTAAWLAGCGSLPVAVKRQPTFAIAPQADSPLVRVVTASAPRSATGLSGVRLLPLGPYSLDARLQLVQRAVHSIDIQYYVFDNDSTGRLLLSELERAAQRGVRVRLLVDDLYTANSESMLRAMSATPGVEVRLFNAFCCARSHGPVARFAASLLDVRRLNHRMHNKLLLADGAMAITGGRNIADDYFQRGSQTNFVDMDALVVGAVVGDLAAVFDRYWNSDVVRPIQALTPATGGVDTLRADFQSLTADARAAPPLALLPQDLLGYGPVGVELDAGRMALHWGPALALADPPDKLTRDADKAWADSLAYSALMKIWTAEGEVTITSPYLIPGPLGIDAFRALRDRHVKVTVLTNSLAATDEPLVHTGYARYRPALVDAGVALYELSPSRAPREKRLGVIGSSSGRLHAKTAVVDGDKVFIGSMNLDPRSRTQNTELGLFVENRQLASEMSLVVDVSRLQSAYRVRRSPESGQLQWLVRDNQGETVHDTEPEASFWLRLHNAVLGVFVPEQLL